VNDAFVEMQASIKYNGVWVLLMIF